MLCGGQVGAGRKSARPVGLHCSSDRHGGIKLAAPDVSSSGYGSSCFPNDTVALVTTVRDGGTPLRLVKTVMAVIDQKQRPYGPAR